MCGISGIISANNRSKMAKEILAMTETLSHRGPDGEGYVLFDEKKIKVLAGSDTPEYIDSANLDYIPHESISSSLDFECSVAFGHRRLAVIDVSLNGHQPMAYLSRYWIIFNGEIYNYRELKEKLSILNYSFNTGSDTEVILAAFDAWGTSCLKHFNGMWAFCIYDTISDKVFIARDRFGVKPLYYYWDEEQFVFASEAKAFLANTRVETKPNISIIKKYLEEGFDASISETAFEKIFSMPSGSYLEIKRKHLNKRPVFVKYYNLPNSISEDSFSDFLEKYDKNFLDAVKLRLRSDVSIGTSLSGGLDSSAVAYNINYLMKLENRAEKQKTFSLVFRKKLETKSYDESEFIEILRSQLELNSYFIEPTVDDVMAIYDKAVYHLDFPQDSSLMSAVFTYKLTSDCGCRVTLDGQGSDEIQGGYLHYLRNYFTNLPFAEILSEWNHFKQIPSAKSQILLGVVFRILKMFGLKKPTRLVLKTFGKKSDPFITINEHLKIDFENNMQNLLLIGDRTSMMHSVESRFPFLDYRLVELLFQQPYFFKINSGWTKYPLRVLFSDRLPSKIVWRKDKMGWEIPEKLWFLGKMKANIFSEVTNSNFLKSLGANISILDKLNSHGISHSALKKIIRLYNLAVWHRIYFQKMETKL